MAQRKTVAQVIKQATAAETDAAGHLLAAAPDLLEQVELFVRFIEWDIRRSMAEGDDEGANLKGLTLHTARAALAKARGERL